MPIIFKVKQKDAQMKRKTHTILHYIKERKIRSLSLAKRMGYTSTYLSRVFNGHSPWSLQFTKLLIFALQEIANEKVSAGEKDLLELKKIIEEEKE